MEQFNQTMVDLKMQLTALSAKRENSSNSLKRLKEFHEDSMMRLEQLSREISNKIQKSESAKLGIAGHEDKLSQLYETIKSLDESIDRDEVDYQQIDARLKDSDSKIADIKTKREKSLEKFRTLELEMSQLQLKRDNTASRLEERYQSDFEVLKSEFGRDEAAR
jgi:chromosome segregation protein